MAVQDYGTTCEPPTPRAPASEPNQTSSPEPGGSQPEPEPEPTSSPEPPPSGSAEPEPSATIDRPLDGSRLRRNRFRAVTGHTSDAGAAQRVDVALVLVENGRCRWWNADRRALVRGSCDAPRWATASGVESWKLPVPPLLEGRYKAFARATDNEGESELCCELGANEVRFRLF